MSPFNLSKKERKAIMDYSKACLLNLLNLSNDGILKQKNPLFFSIYKQGQLRGRAGVIDSKKIIAYNLKRLVKAAAFEDPRFNPVSKEEFPELELEVSILGDYELIEAKSPHELLDSFELGVHGLLLRKKLISAVSLPQEAEEGKMSRMEFVSMLCQKAGLRSLDWWKARMLKIYRFTVLILKEDFQKF